MNFNQVHFNDLTNKMWDTVTDKVASLWDNSSSYDDERPGRSNTVPAQEGSPFECSTSAIQQDKFIFYKETDVVFGFKPNSQNGSCDVTFSAHRLVLSLWSPYFADKFYGRDNKRENIIIVRDFHPQAFNFMLRFMYEESPCIETCEEALEIYKVAVKYEVQSLLNECVNYVKHFKPQISNVFEALESAINMNLKYMQEYCLKMIQNNTSKVFESCNISKISVLIIESILDMQSLSLNSEFELLEWIFKWAKNEYVTKSQYSSVREVLEEFLPKLYFLSLTSQEFAKFYKLHESFFNRDEAFNILMNIAMPLSMPSPEWQYSDSSFRRYTGPYSVQRFPRHQGWDEFD